jgi:hypothetical protein
VVYSAERLVAIANTRLFHAIRYRRYDGSGGKARPALGDDPTYLSTNRDAASDRAGGHTTRTLARRSVARGEFERCSSISSWDLATSP